MRVFADTSALLKRYVEEQGTEAVEQILQRASDLIVSALTLVEAMSALRRRNVAGELATKDYQSVREDLLVDLADMEWVPIDERTLTAAVHLVEVRGLRTLDSLQLACALASAPDLFLCADRVLLAAAAREGLSVLDPATSVPQR